MKIPKPTKSAKEKFQYFVSCQDEKRLTPISEDPNGYTALECFHYHETYGKELLPCKEPLLLARALNGKEWHGLTITHLAEDYLRKILFASEIKANYPPWVQKDILGRAKQLALHTLGYIPTFVLTGEDFTTLSGDWKKDEKIISQKIKEAGLRYEPRYLLRARR